MYADFFFGVFNQRLICTATELRNICRNEWEQAQKVRGTETVCPYLFRYSVPLKHVLTVWLQISRSSAALILNYAKRKSAYISKISVHQRLKEHSKKENQRTSV